MSSFNAIVKQREIDMRRDLYDLSRQSSRAAALEAELKCLKANIGPPTVAYEVPVQLDDIAPPEVTTAVQMSPLRLVTPVTPIDDLAVQGLSPNITKRQDTAHALTWNPHVEDANTPDNCHGAGILTSQPPCLSSAMDEPTVCRADSVHTFPRELPQPSAPSNPGYSHHQSDTLSRRPVTAVSDPLHIFPRSLEPACTQPQQFYAPSVVAADPVLQQYQSDTHPRLHMQSRLLPEPACIQSTMTSVLPCQPVYPPCDMATLTS